MELSDLMSSEETHIKNLNQIVHESIKNEQLITSKLLEVENDEGAT